MSELTARGDADVMVRRLEQRLARERRARAEAEAIAEQGLRDLYERQRELALLEATAAAANRAASVGDAMQFAVTSICDYTGWTVGHVYICQTTAEGESLRSGRIWHVADRARFQPFCDVTQDTVLRYGEGLPGRVVAGRAPAVMSDVSADEAFVRRATAAPLGLRLGVGVPVLTGANVAAVLEFYSDSHDVPSPTLLQLLAQIGTQLGRVVERAAAEERLRHDAYHDPLTGLPNRSLFKDRVARALARRHRNPGYLFAVLLIDLDRFKMVNDSLGHLIGDELLIDVAGRLQGTLRRDDGLARPLAPGHRTFDDTLARLGGDEFTILLDDIRDTSDALRVAERVHATLERPIVVNGHQMTIRASIGIALSQSAETRAHELMRDADIAMYRAKTLGGAQSAIFDPHMHAAALARLDLEGRLRLATERHEFRLHYQPIVDLDHDHIKGFEALVRWQHPEQGLVWPDRFVQVAEESGQIVAIDEWVLRQACRDAQTWSPGKDVTERPSVSVNVSARSFALPDLADRVFAILTETGLPAQRLRLEVTETVAMRDAQRAAATMERLRQVGVGLSLDDFGTGYSSFSYLRRFPVDVLKIDRSFVGQIDRDTESREIVRAILHLARALSLRVVAEGPESSAQVEELRQMRCEWAQGYFFSGPVPSFDLADRFEAIR